MDASQMLKYIRARGGLSRADLGRLADVAPSVIGRIESGGIEPTQDVMNRILEASGYKPLANLQPSGDPAAVRAGRRALGEIADEPSPEEIVWLARWRRARFLGADYRVVQVDRLLAQIGIAAPVLSRPNRTVSVVYDQPWQVVTRKLSDESVPYAVTGITATSATRSTDGSAWPLFYVEDIDRAVAAAGLTVASKGGAVMTFIDFDTTSATGTIEEGRVMWVSPGQALIDAYAGPGRMADRAIAVASRLERKLASQ